MKWAKCSDENNAISVSRLISLVISVLRYKFSKRINRYLLTLEPTAMIYNLYVYNEEDFLSLAVLRIRTTSFLPVSPMVSGLFLHFSRPRFLAAMRFYYPGVDSSQFSLASHNLPEDSLGEAWRPMRYSTNKTSRGWQQEHGLILEVWQSTGGASFSGSPSLCSTV